MVTQMGVQRIRVTPPDNRTSVLLQWSEPRHHETIHPGNNYLNPVLRTDADSVHRFPLTSIGIEGGGIRGWRGGRYDGAQGRSCRKFSAGAVGTGEFLAVEHGDGKWRNGTLGPIEWGTHAL